MHRNDRHPKKVRRRNPLDLIIRTTLRSKEIGEVIHNVIEWAFEIWECIEPWLSNLF